MQIIKPSVEFLGAVPTDYNGAIRFIEAAGRTCYKSENRITEDSAEAFVKRLIKAGHLAMVEHSNFVVRHPFDVPKLIHANTIKGSYLSLTHDRGTLYLGGNLTAWYNNSVPHCENVSWENLEMFTSFIQQFGVLFDMSHRGLSNWQICPHDEIPLEMHRYSARFICDRGVSHELVRHRPASYAQESTRYVNYGGKDMQFIEPAGFDDWPTWSKLAFTDVCTQAESIYKVMLSMGLKPQQARAVLPNALKTEIVVTADLTEWKHIFKLRCAPSAHPDMIRLMSELRDKFTAEGIPI